MFSLSFLELVIRETRSFRKEWRIVRDYGETSCGLTTMKSMPGEQDSIPVRDFLREGGALARSMSHAEAAEALADYIAALEGQFEREAQH